MLFSGRVHTAGPPRKWRGTRKDAAGQAAAARVACRCPARPHPAPEHAHLQRVPLLGNLHARAPPLQRPHAPRQLLQARVALGRAPRVARHLRAWAQGASAARSHGPRWQRAVLWAMQGVLQVPGLASARHVPAEQISTRLPPKYQSTRSRTLLHASRMRSSSRDRICGQRGGAMRCVGGSARAARLSSMGRERTRHRCAAPRPLRAPPRAAAGPPWLAAATWCT